MTNVTQINSIKIYIKYLKNVHPVRSQLSQLGWQGWLCSAQHVSHPPHGISRKTQARPFHDHGRSSREQMTHMQSPGLRSLSALSLLPYCAGEPCQVKKPDLWSKDTAQLPGKGPGEGRGEEPGLQCYLPSRSIRKGVSG